MRPILTLFLLLSTISLFAQNAFPDITNLEVQIDESSQTVTATYDLFDAEGEEMDVFFLVSNDGGISYNIETTNATGDLGSGISSGTNKTITWDAAGLLPNIGNYRVKVIADDLFEIDIQSIVDQVDPDRLLSNLEYIEGPRHRTTGSTLLGLVKDTIEQSFLAANLETSRKDFLYNSYTGQNILGRMEGSNHADSSYIIDGHFDTVDDSPGADDNGSAVVGMLEVLRVLAPYRFRKTLHFVGFDLEEEGLKGSFDYTANSIPDSEIIKGVFNLEMIGYYTDEPNTQEFPAGFEILYPEVQAELEADQFRGNFITNIGDQNSIALQMAYDAAAAAYVPDLKTIAIAAPDGWAVLTPDFGRSDHAPFWLMDIPALMLTDGSNFRNPFYHSPNDLISTLDFTFMANVVKAVVGAVAEEAGIQHSDIAIADFNLLTSSDNTLDCGLRISPVPTKENLNLLFEDCNFEELEIMVFDVLGNLLLEQEVNPTSNATLKLNLEKLDAGIYLLNVSNGKQSMTRKVLVE